MDEIGGNASQQQQQDGFDYVIGRRRCRGRGNLHGGPPAGHDARVELYIRLLMERRVRLVNTAEAVRHQNEGANSSGAWRDRDRLRLGLGGASAPAASSCRHPLRRGWTCPSRRLAALAPPAPPPPPPRRRHARRRRPRSARRRARQARQARSASGTGCAHRRRCGQGASPRSGATCSRGGRRRCGSYRPPPRHSLLALRGAGVGCAAATEVAAPTAHPPNAGAGPAPPLKVNEERELEPRRGRGRHRSSRAARSYCGPIDVAAELLRGGACARWRTTKPRNSQFADALEPDDALDVGRGRRGRLRPWARRPHSDGTGCTIRGVCSGSCA